MTYKSKSKSENAALKSEITEKGNQIAALKIENAALWAAVKLRSQLDDAQKEIEVLRKENEHLKNEIEALKSQPKYQVYKPEETKRTSSVDMASMYNDVITGSPSASLFAETPKI